jgi:hypothetical protein
MFRTRLPLIATFISATFLLSFLPAQSATIAGTSCSKLNTTKTVANIKYTCVKSGKKFVWNKGVTVSTHSPEATPTPTATPTSSPTPSPTPTPSVTPTINEGDSCSKMGLQIKFPGFTLECRKFANNKLNYVRLNYDFSPLNNPASPELSTFCRLSDMRTTVPPNTYAIAYPPKPFINYTPTGTFKVVVVGIDFSDVPGKGSPAEIWNDDLKKASDWLKWYANDKVKFNFVTYPNWIRAPRTSDMYDSTNHGPKAPGDVQAGGLTGQEIAEDYVHSIEKYADLSGVNTIWIYLPENISKIMGQWTMQTARVQTQNYGLITPQIAALGADTYLSKRVRWGYFLHEMIHGFGLQGHSPKYLPANGFTRIGMMSTADGWTNALLPWDAMTWGVDKPEDTFCVDKEKLTSVDVKLVPLEREQAGFRSAMIRLNDHQVLLVESHRSDKWGVGEGQGFAGVMVTLIDTTISTSFDDNVTARSPNTTSTGEYLIIDGVSHGQHQPIGELNYNNGVLYGGVGVVNGQGIAGDYEYWDLNHIMYTGESITKLGVRISLIAGGDNDTVRIEKTN